MSEETIFNASGRRMVRAVAATSSGLSTTRSTGDATPILPSKALAAASLNEVPAAILGISAGTSTVLAGRSKASAIRSEEHTSELQSLMRRSEAVTCLQTN